MPQSFVKDPNAVLDYTWDWDDWLATAETISTHTITADTGITVDSSSIVGTDAVTAWLSGGTANYTYGVTCRITTSSGRTDDRTIRLQMEPR